MQRSMPIKTMFQRLFTSPAKAGNSQQNPMHVSKASSISQDSISLKEIHEISVFEFIKAYVDGDLSVLLHRGSYVPPDWKLKDHFNNVMIEYHDLIGSPETKTLVQLRKKIIQLRSKIAQVISVGYSWNENRKHTLLEILHSHGFFPSEDASKQDVYNQLVAHVKDWEVDLDVAENDMELYINKKKSNDKATKKTFLDNVVVLKKNGFQIDMHKTMLDEYAVAIHHYNQMIEQTRK